MPRLGEYRNRVRVETPGVPVPDDDGGYTVGWTPLDPADWHCSIVPATARELETVAAGTVIAQASHVIRGRYHPGITTQARIVFENRIFSVVGVVNRDERDLETDLVCSEVIE